MVLLWQVFAAVRHSTAAARHVVYPMRSCSEHSGLLNAVSGGYLERIQKTASMVTVLRLRHDISQMTMLSEASSDEQSDMYAEALHQYGKLQGQVNAIAPEPYLPVGYQRDSSNATDPSIQLPDGWKQRMAPFLNRAVSVPHTPVSDTRV